MSQEPYLSVWPVIIRRIFVLLFVAGFLFGIYFTVVATSDYRGWVLLVVAGGGILMTLRRKHQMDEGLVQHRTAIRAPERKGS